MTSCLEGYNGTIFAYGQTGSGKTYSITGSAERYEDRGLIPRILSLIFEETAQRTDAQWTVRISYMEIYNGKGYDLLDPSHDSKQLENLPRITMLRDEQGNIHMRNIGELPAASVGKWCCVCNGMHGFYSQV